MLFALLAASGFTGKGFLQLSKGGTSKRKTEQAHCLVPVEFSLCLGSGAKCRTSWEASLGGSLCLTFKTFEYK